MREVIRIDEPKQKAEKPVEFTHYLSLTSGWVESVDNKDYYKILYLGKCEEDGDMFAAYDGEYISIFKGHLNSGKY